MTSFPRTNAVVSFILGFSIIGSALVLAFAPGVRTERVEAGGAVVVVGGNGTIQETISAGANTLTSGSLASLVVKDFTLDGIAFAVINMMIQQMTRSIVSWINSGFQGEPSFLRDIDGFLTGIADRAVGEFIGSTQLGSFLCSPFRLNIRAALEFQYATTRNFGSPANTCTLSGMEQNIANFMNGNAINDWGTWFRITQNPQYNMHGALLLSQEQMSMKLSNSKGQSVEMLGWGKGFLSSQECTRIEGESRSYCRTVTPGSTIEASLNEALGAQGRRIQVADEFNEIFAALASQFVTQAIGGIGGLLGLTGSGGSAPANPYYSQLMSQPSGVVLAQNPIQESLNQETIYRDLMQGLVTRINNAELYEQINYPSCGYGAALTPQLRDALVQATANVTQANGTMATLSALLARYNAAGGNNVLQNEILSEYNTLQSRGILHTSADIYTIRNAYVSGLNSLIDTYTENIDRQCQSVSAGV